MRRKQFSLSLVVRVLLGLFVLTSLIVFATGVMKANELKKETAELNEILDGLEEKQAKLTEQLGSIDEVREILSDYKAYEEAVKNGGAASEYEDELARLRELLNNSKYKDTIIGIAKERLNLYYPDEQIIYNDRNETNGR